MTYNSLFSFQRSIFGQKGILYFPSILSRENMAKSLGNYIIKDVKPKYTACASPCQGKSPCPVIYNKKYQIVIFYDTSSCCYQSNLACILYSDFCVALRHPILNIIIRKREGYSVFWLLPFSPLKKDSSLLYILVKYIY